MKRAPENVRIFADANAVATAAAQEIVAAAEASIRAHSSFSLALAGGATPRRLYGLLADPRRDLHEQVPWSRTELFFSDERCVPADHAESNYRMARETLLDHVPIPPAAIHYVHTEIGDPAACAEAYARELVAAIGGDLTTPPRLDLVLLGMGADGHTASLFPGSRALDETTRWVVSNRVDSLDSWRVTLTLPVINAARAVLFVVTGENKAEALAQVLAAEPAAPRSPAGRVRPTAGTVAWLVDMAAARLLGRA